MGKTSELVDYDYDVVVSYAGEDRPHVAPVVEKLKAAGVRVFYDQDELATIWGENLVDFLQAVYARRARYAILFVSAAYVAKKWTNHERQAAQDRALQEASAYILPVKLDDTELPGIHSTVAYIDMRQVGMESLASLALEKIRQQEGAVKPQKFNGRVPRNAEEVGVLLTERPPGWEYLLFGSVLRARMDEMEDAYRDFELQYAPVAGPTLTNPSDGVRFIQERIATSRAMGTQMMRLLAPKAQDAAFGIPGESGDADRIIHLASRLIGLYGQLLDWAAEIHGARAEDDLSGLLLVVARFIEQPVTAFRTFVTRLVSELDTMNDRLDRGEEVAIILELNWEIPDGLMNEYDEMFDEYVRRNGLDSN